MGKLGLSATEIGSQIGASAMEVNRLLKDQGFLRGEPGAYGLTPKGEEFAVQRDHDNGYGGLAYRSWTFTHFDPSITNVLDAAPEKLAKVRADIAADKEARKLADKIAQDEAEANFLAAQAEKKAAATQYEIDPQKVILLVGITLVAVASAIGVREGIKWYKRKKAARAAAEEPGTDMPTGDDGE